MREYIPKIPLGHGELQMKVTSKGVLMQFTITPSSPYYLGVSDNLGTPLVAVLLVGDNYHNLARSLKVALCAKTKLGFIDGTIKKQSSALPELYAWKNAYYGYCLTHRFN